MPDEPGNILTGEPLVDANTGSPLADAYGPTTPAATTVSRTEAELALVEARRTALLAQKEREDAAKAATTPSLRRLAIALHGALCPSNHADLTCTWETDPNATDSEVADWTEPAHRRWLGVAQMGVFLQMSSGWRVDEPGWHEPTAEEQAAALTALGWTVSPPSEPPPEEPPPEEPPPEEPPPEEPPPEEPPAEPPPEEPPPEEPGP